MTKRPQWTGIAFLSPSLVGFLSFTLLPVIGAVALSLCEWDLFHAPRFVGLENYKQLLGGGMVDGVWEWGDPQFWKFLGNTLYFMAAIPVSMGASLWLAILLNKRIPFRSAFRAIFFLPTICFGIGVLLLWKFLFNPQFGLINQGLHLVGIDGPGWLQSYVWAKPAIMIMGLWASAGGTNMILYIAGLQGISPELYEAAAIGGAGGWHQFWSVTVPGLRPTTFFIFTTCLIAGFQGEFDSAYVMTQGGPSGSTTTLALYIYREAFQWFNMGYASAIALSLFVLVMGTTLLNWRLSGRGGADA